MQQQVRLDRSERDERVDWHLENWAAWMCRPRLNLWYRSRACANIGGTSSRDFDAMVASEDTRCAVAVDAIIDSLALPERLAIHHVHLCAVWRLRCSIADSYAAAREHVAIGLGQRGIW